VIPAVGWVAASLAAWGLGIAVPLAVVVGRAIALAEKRARRERQQ
jgi:hypothetical protein